MYELLILKLQETHMENNIESKRKAIEKRHYILKANLPNYFFNARPSKIQKYRNKYKDDFCFILYQTSQLSDCYVIPFSKLKNLFTQENLVIQENPSPSPRWLGTISNGQLKLSGNAKKEIDISDCRKTLQAIDSFEINGGNRESSCLTTS